jgi:hypothetical protein
MKIFKLSYKLLLNLKITNIELYLRKKNIR